MFFQSLKFKLAGNLAVIILISVLFSDLVIVSVIQKSLIRERVAKGRQYLHALPDAETGLGVHDPGIIYFNIRSGNGLDYHYGEPSTDLQKFIHRTGALTIKEGKGQTEFAGETFGVFWHQKKYLLISEPIPGIGPENKGLKIMVMELDDIYKALRHSQKIILFYVLANFIILLLFGVYRLSRLMIRPIHRFIKMTDEFREKDRLYFTHGKNYREFNQLSKALNHMLDLIETDKQNLRHSLDELEKANRELKNAQDEMVKAEKLASVGRLSAGIAHEIGNPLSIVLGYLDLLNARPSLKKDDDAHDYLNRMQYEINRIHSIIRQLLDFSRSSSEDCRVISIHDLVRDVVTMMSDQPLIKNIAFDIRLSDISDTVAIDKDQMRQVLINLIINAADSIHASEQKMTGEIQVASEFIPEDASSALNHHATFLLKVMDNGSGIAEEDINCIFDPFFTTKLPGKGTGLGLTVSYMIIEQAGGRMMVESKINQGTSILIYLPIYQKQ
ncbi:MAG: hypothetical protein COX19_12855 [Desulfobacterales bacterium CG23_combo_of_CG06-09_8_20_14_all_51_8]|nr:MAG: hypothetical protein COX19_12855 [Desulfobacterales bacterium CG23_combo_of_CG06-09_8_20_14_all_51_8]